MGRKRRLMLTWLLVGCVLVFFMVLIGGITRLTHSGLSMVQWNFIGRFPPLNEARWNELFDAYRKSPEFLLVNHHFSLGDFKQIFWWEFIHRTLARTIGWIFVLPFLFFLLARWMPSWLLRRVIFIAALGLTQGLFGWWMVKSGLSRLPHVSPYLLALHLATAFTIFGLLFWSVLDLLRDKKNTQPGDARLPLRTQLVLVVVQVIYGGLVAGLKAGLVFNTFPRMDNRWIAPEAYRMQPFWRNLLENGAGVQFVHRVLALLIVIHATRLFILVRRANVSKEIKAGVNVLCVLVAAQFSLGVATLVTGVPVPLAAIHQAGAFLLFANSVFLLHCRSANRYRVEQQSHAATERNEQQAEPDPRRIGGETK